MPFNIPLQVLRHFPLWFHECYLSRGHGFHDHALSGRDLHWHRLGVGRQTMEHKTPHRSNHPQNNMQSKRILDNCFRTNFNLMLTYAIQCFTIFVPKTRHSPFYVSPYQTWLNEANQRGCPSVRRLPHPTGGYQWPLFPSPCSSSERCSLASLSCGVLVWVFLIFRRKMGLYLTMMNKYNIYLLSMKQGNLSTSNKQHLSTSLPLPLYLLPSL